MSGRGRGRGGGRGASPGGDRGRGGSRGGAASRGSSRGGRGGGGGGGGGGGPVEVFRDQRLATIQPSSDIQRIENEFMTNAGGVSGLSLREDMPRRPGHGTQGTPIVVWANYFELTPAKDLSLYRYAIDVYEGSNQASMSKIRLRRLFNLLLESPSMLGVATDYRSTLISRNPIPGVPGDLEVTFRAEGEDQPAPDAKVYRVRVQETGTLQVSTLLNYLKSTDPNGPELVQSLDIVQALNIVLGHYPQARADITTVSQNKHYALNPRNYHVLGGGMEALRGLSKSIRLATGRILLNVNVSHGVFYEPIRLDQTMRRLGTAKKPNLAKYLKYLRVKRLHLPPKKNKSGDVFFNAVTIWDVANTNDGFGDEHPPQVLHFAAGPRDVKFWLRATSAAASSSKKGSKPAEGRYVSVFDYFQQKYPNFRLDPALPVVNVGNRERPSYLPAETCEVLPGQSMKRKLLADETRQMIEFACRRPKDNFDSIVGDGKAVLGLAPARNTGIAAFGLSVSATVLTVPARILNPPVIKYGNKPITPRSGSWNLDRVQFTTGSRVDRWTVLWIKSNRARHREPFHNMDHVIDVTRAFVRFMNDEGIAMGAPIQVPPPPTRELIDGDDTQNDAVISDVFNRMSDHRNKPHFVLVILPFNDVSIYRRVKIMGDVKTGIHTVCVVGSKFVKAQPQYFANVSMKFNFKAGGINQTLDPPKLGIISEGTTMVVGIDVTHPSPGSKDNAPSVAGIVASVDRTLGQWPGDLRIQEGRKEMVSALKDMFKGRLSLWKQRNSNSLPSNVIIYRDGVSEGQFQTVLDVELPQIRQACKEMYPASDTTKGIPALSIIIVGKRHHTRFTPTNPADADRSHNCKNGTVVDRGVTQVRNWHFFLQAHTCLQGTARPASYFVLLDEIFRVRKSKNPMHKNAADELEDLTHNMCHLFARATKAVSLCPPAYYADLLCERARCYLGRVFDPVPASTPTASEAGAPASETARDEDVMVHPNLRDSMFYL